MNKTFVTILGVLGGAVTGFICGIRLIFNLYDSHCGKLEYSVDKFSDYYNLMLQWLKNHQQGKKLDVYFHNNGFKSVAIYGMNDVAYAIITELKETEIRVAYCIDRNADNLFLEFDSYKPDDDLPDVDVCIIALPELFEEISELLKSRLDCPIVSIEDVVWKI